MTGQEVKVRTCRHKKADERSKQHQLGSWNLKLPAGVARKPDSGQ